MNNRSGVFTFFLFLILLIIIVLQLLLMVQSDRLYRRIDHVFNELKDSGDRITEQKTGFGDLPVKEERCEEGDWLIWRIGAEPATQNPLTKKDISTDWIVTGNIFEGLLEYDLDSAELKPLLAGGYKITADGQEIIFGLRDDVHFSDGQKITADDVIFSYQTIINPGVDAQGLANYYYPVREVIKIDSRTIKFTLREPYFKGVEICGQMPILPKHIYKFIEPGEFNGRRSGPVGSGPYIFERWDVGREIVLRRNENYWGQKPALSKIVFRVITNELGAIQSLRGHEIDFMAPSCEQFAELSDDKEFTGDFNCLSYWNPGVGYSYIGWNAKTVFFNDRRVRLAMTQLIDREMIIKHLTKGLGRIVTGPFYIFSKQYDSSIEPWPYDTARAKELLDEAGWIDRDGDGIRDKEGRSFRFKFMVVSGYQEWEQLARLLKDGMAKAGVDLIVEPYEWSVFEERLNSRSFDSAVLAWGGTILEDPYQIWHSSQIKGRGFNRVGFNNPEADSIIEQARVTLDEQRRNELYHRFHRIVHQEQPYTFMRARPSMRFIDRRFENVIVHKLGLNPQEWYVPKEKQRYK